jgi:hypothetical protein
MHENCSQDTELFALSNIPTWKLLRHNNYDICSYCERVVVPSRFTKLEFFSCSLPVSEMWTVQNASQACYSIPSL